MPPKQQTKKTVASASGAKPTARGGTTTVSGKAVGVKGGAAATGKKPTPATSAGRQPVTTAGRGSSKTGQPPGKTGGPVEKKEVDVKKTVKVDEGPKVDVVIGVRELDEVLMKDVGDKIAQSGKWPLIIDPGEQCATFLRYRDTNYLSAIRPKDMESERIRLALLGAIRYGKFFVLDLLNVEGILPAVQQQFDQVQPDLLPAILSQQFFKEEKYLQLLKEGDGEEFSRRNFMFASLQDFKFVVITQLLAPPEELLRQCYVIKIRTPQPS